MDFNIRCKRILSFLLMLTITGACALPASASGAALQETAGTAAVTDTVISDDFYLDEPERKDPFIAGLLSWSWSGLGQFYTQSYTRGSLFLAADIAQKGLLIYGIFYYSDKYSGEDGNIVKWKNISNRDKGIIIGYLFSMLIMKIVCVVDAVNSAEEYNRDIYFPYWKRHNRFRFSIENEDDRINISMSRSFTLL
ncbi:MAG TPA: hypothetical protein PK544_09050 [Spirochaetota bacterium]|nr:hypothetical protein [Spirochaetota bacterium]HPJ37325.1 hypothetical protein [Spirochaetota bacterium]